MRSLYEEIVYPGQCVPATAPASLALTARVHGGPRARLERLRVLEIGCGDGANLIGLAFHHPDWTLEGVDASPRAIERARESAGTIGLSNVSFECGDLANANANGDFDAVIAHGVYSWIDPDRRAALRRLIGRALAADGLAYVSFNALPAWGVRGLVREMLVRDRARGVEAAREKLQACIDIACEAEHAWGALLLKELERAAQASDAYLAHEYLAEHNDAFWLGDVIAAFRADAMRYVGDASFHRDEGFVHPAMRGRVAELERDATLREETIDLLAYRQLRCAVFAKGDASFENAAGPELIEQAFIASAVRARNDPFDIAANVEQNFLGPRGTEIKVTSPLSKIALLLMADRYPEAFLWDDLCTRAETFLASHEIEVDDGARERLRAGLWTLFAANEIEVRLHQPPLRVDPGETPRACALSRMEARQGAVLTTPLHTAIPLDPIDRAIVERLDGTLALSALAASIAEEVERGELMLEGAPAGIDRTRAFLEERATSISMTLGWWGLLQT